MTPDEARELFSEALEGELDEARREALERALESDGELKAEYEEFVETMRLVGRMGDVDELESPDLLRGVQDRLRRRSKGRYYRDRFARRAGPGWALPVLAVMVVLLVIAVAWLVVRSTVVLVPGHGVDESVQHVQ